MEEIKDAGYLQKFFAPYVWKILSAFLLLLLIHLLTTLPKYIQRRTTYNKLMVGCKYPWYDPLGLIRDVFSHESFKNGTCINAVVLQLAKERVEQFGKYPLFSDWISYLPIVVLTKAEAVETLFKYEDKKAKTWFYSFMEPVFGTGLLTSTGDKWKSRRKLLNPCFHSKVIKDFLPVFNEDAQKLVKSIQQQNKGDFMRVGSHVGLCVLEILLKTIFGIKQGVEQRNGSQYVESAKKVQKIAYERVTKVFYWPNFIFNLSQSGREMKQHVQHMRDFTNSVIQQKKLEYLPRESPQTTGGNRRALMDFLVEHHLTTDELSEDDIREEVDTFVIAGLGTTSASICWSLYLIGLHKDVQLKVHEELDAVFGNELETPVGENDLKELTYLNRVLKESKRLYPPVPSFQKLCGEDFNVSGCTVPKGVTCIIMTYFIHRDEQQYPNPELFDPDRFLPENCAKRHPYAYLPFSLGSRSCIGAKFSEMEEKVIVSTILRQFTVESEDQRDKVPSFEITLRPSVPIRIKFTPRR